MSVSKCQNTALLPDKDNHFVNKVALVFRKRSSYSFVYTHLDVIDATPSMDLMWWALQGTKAAGKAISATANVPLRMIYGDAKEKNEVEVKLSRIGLMCMQLFGNVKVSSIAIFLLQIATEFGYTVIDLTRRVIALFSDWDLCPTQLFQNMRQAVMSFLVRWGVLGERGEIAPDPVGAIIQAEQTLDIELDADQVVALSGLMGGLAVILAAGFAGYTDYSPNKGFLRSIAEFGSKASKLKNGLYAILTCIKDFSTFVKECVMNYCGSSPADSVVKAIESLKFTFNGEPVKAEELFDALTELNTQEGEDLMATNEEAYRKGVAVCGVFSRVVSGQLTEAFNIPSGTANLLGQTLRTFEQRVRSAGVKQSMGNVRFTPFCVWIAGSPGCGKSVALAEMVRLLMCTLQDMDAEKFEVPEMSQWCHSANFTQEYHTGYNGQYVFQIDDMCQDKCGTLKNSSALQFIQWVSSIPANVTQAALEDKKCPFRSKVLMCTSNELYPNRSHEIVSPTAFLRRRNVVVEAQKSDRMDPFLNWPIEFQLRDPLEQTKPPVKLGNFYDLMDHVVEQYIDHFEKQTKLVSAIKNGTADEYLTHRAIKAEQSFEVFATEVIEAGVGDSESFDAQDQLVMAPQDEYNQMMTFVTQVPRQEYWFTNGTFVRRHPEYAFTILDALRVMSVRPFVKDESKLAAGRRNVSGVVEAEQSFWEINRAPAMAWDAFAQLCKSSAQRCRNFWETMSSSLWWKVLAGFSTIAAGYLVYRYAVADKPWRDVVEAEATYDQNVVRGKPIARSQGVQSYNHEIGRSKAHVRTVQAIKSSFVQSVFHRNMVELRVPHGSMNGIFIKGTTLLTCRHFFSGIAEGTQFEVVKYPKYAQPVSVNVTFNSSRLVRIPGAEDAVLYHVGPKVDSCRDISKKFCAGVLPEYMDAAITSVYPEQEVVIGPTSTFVENQRVEYRIGVRSSDGPDDRPLVQLVKGFNFQGHYRRGKSGSPLIADEKVNRTPTIFGIQTCISEKFETSYFEAISQHQIDAAMGSIEAIQSMFEEADDRWDQEDEESWFDATDDIRNICGRSLEFIGPVKQMVHQATETKLRRSLLAPFFEPLEDTKMFKPAVLKDQHEDILTKSMAGYCRNYGCVDERTLIEVTRQFIAEDRVVRRSNSKRLLTRDEVLNGLRGQGLKGLDLNTSPGVPLTFEKEPGKPGKKTWITMNDEDQREMRDDVWEQFDRAEADLRRGKMISLTAYACLKDELRTESKVAAKKTRSFIVLPLIYNMMIRKYFGQWIACQHRLAGKISSSVGIDANSDWTDLKRRLCAMGTDVEDFDYSDWDRSLNPEWFAAYAERVSAWYGDSKNSPGWKVRDLLMRQLVFMNIQVGAWLLRTHGGNKSGCAITAEINTDIHEMLMHYVWVRICQQTGRQSLTSLAHFRERVALALYGDDMLKTTRSDVTPWFNGDAIKAQVAELGMHITPGDKDETHGFRIKSIDEVTFLKRGFLSLDEDAGRVRAPLDKSVIQRMVLWVHKSDSPIDAVRANVHGALRESFFWGEDFFRDFTKRCQDAWARSKCAYAPFPLVHYQAILDAWNTGHGDMPALFQFRVVSPDGVEEEL